MVSFDEDSINTFLGWKWELPTYKHTVYQTHQQETVDAYTAEEAAAITNEFYVFPTFPVHSIHKRYLNSRARLIMQFLNSNLTPTKHDTEVKPQVGRLIGAYLQGRVVSPGQVIVAEFERSRYRTRNFTFPCLITSFFEKWYDVAVNRLEVVSQITISNTTVHRMIQNYETEQRRLAVEVAGGQQGGQQQQEEVEEEPESSSGPGAFQFQDFQQYFDTQFG